MNLLRKWCTGLMALAALLTTAEVAAQPATLASLPSVRLTRPAPVAVGGSFMLQGIAQAAAGLASAEAYIDNRPLFNRAVGGNALDIGSLGINVPVTARSQTIRFVARDRTGKIMQDAFQLDALQPQQPAAAGNASIAFNPPAVRAGGSAVVSGMVSAPQGVAQIDLTLRYMNTIVGSEKRVVNGTAVPLESLNWRPSFPGAGTYTLTIDAIDRNRAATTRTFTFSVGY